MSILASYQPHEGMDWTSRTRNLLHESLFSCTAIYHGPLLNSNELQFSVEYDTKEEQTQKGRHLISTIIIRTNKKGQLSICRLDSDQVPTTQGHG
jgi:hypothetical protein